MSTDKLINDYFRVERTEREIFILVRTVGWEGPATQVDTWVVGRFLPRDTTDKDLQAAVDEILADRRFFAECWECGQLHAVGRMHDERICQSCAIANHRVVY